MKHVSLLNKNRYCFLNCKDGDFWSRTIGICRNSFTIEKFEIGNNIICIQTLVARTNCLQVLVYTQGAQLAGRGDLLDKVIQGRWYLPGLCWTIDIHLRSTLGWSVHRRLKCTDILALPWHTYHSNNFTSLLLKGFKGLTIRYVVLLFCNSFIRSEATSLH